MKTNSLVWLARIVIALGGPVAVLADPGISMVVVGAQSPDAIQPGGFATFAVAVTKTNSGGVDAYLSVSGLPADITASFAPTPIALKGGGLTTGTSTLTLSASASTPAGVYPFTLTARDGGSPNYLTATGTLIVSANGSEPAPAIMSVSCLSDRAMRVNFKGVPKELFLVQATTNLLVPSWTTIATNTTDLNGLANLIDADSGKYQCRFYRTVKQY